MKIVQKNLVQQVLEEMNAFDQEENLDTDIAQLEDQNYAVVSFIGPSLTAKSDIYGFRVMGVFPDIDSASEHIAELMSDTQDPENKRYDTGIVELYKFVPSYPKDPRKVNPETGVAGPETQEEQDKFLNDIVFTHKKNKELSKIKFEMRKEKVKANKGRYIERETPGKVVKETILELIKNKEREGKRDNLESEDQKEVEVFLDSKLEEFGITEGILDTFLRSIKEKLQIDEIKELEKTTLKTVEDIVDLLHLTLGTSREGVVQGRIEKKKKEDPNGEPSRDNGAKEKKSQISRGLSRAQYEKQQQFKIIQEKYRKKLDLKREQRKKDIEEKKIRVRLNNKKAETRVDYQNYAAICFVGHTGKNKRIAMKIKGVFETLEDCQEHIKELMDIDDTFDILAAEMYNWLPSDPNIEGVTTVHTDEELNEFYKDHKKEEKKATQFHQLRARKDVKEAQNKLSKDFRSHIELKDAYNKSSYSKEDVEAMMSQIEDINKKELENRVSNEVNNEIIPEIYNDNDDDEIKNSDNKNVKDIIEVNNEDYL